MARERLKKQIDFTKIEYRVCMHGPSVLGKAGNYFDARFDTRREAKGFIEEHRGKGDFFRMYYRKFNYITHEWLSDPIIIEEVYG